jgi:hypothetical protein
MNKNFNELPALDKGLWITLVIVTLASVVSFLIASLIFLFS